MTKGVVVVVVVVVVFFFFFLRKNDKKCCNCINFVPRIFCDFIVLGLVLN